MDNKSELKIALTPQITLEHALNNRFNNIKINAELVLLLATRDNNKRIKAVAQIIIEECKRPLPLPGAACEVAEEC